MTDQPSPRRRGLFFGGIGAVLGLIALLSFPAMAGSGFGGDFGHCNRGAHKNMSAEQVQARADRFSQRVLDRVDATDTQRTEVESLLAGIGERAVAHRADREEVRQEWREAFLAEEIDEKQVQALRQDLLDRVDEGSDELIGLATDLASVLTAEQRQELVDFADRWHK